MELLSGEGRGLHTGQGGLVCVSIREGSFPYSVQEVTGVLCSLCVVQSQYILAGN